MGLAIHLTLLNELLLLAVVLLNNTDCFLFGFPAAHPFSLFGA